MNSLKSYWLRMENNHKVFLQLAEELKKKGCWVFSPCSSSHERIKFLLVKKGRLQTMVGFAEVPYRWYIGSEYSGRISDLLEDSYKFPFTVDDVLNEMRESPKEIEPYYEEL